MTDLPTPAAPRRLFTALFPPPEACAAIDAERQRWPGLPRRLQDRRALGHFEGLPVDVDLDHASTPLTLPVLP